LSETLIRVQNAESGLSRRADLAAKVLNAGLLLPALATEVNESGLSFADLPLQVLRAGALLRQLPVKIVESGLRISKLAPELLKTVPLQLDVVREAGLKLFYLGPQGTFQHWTSELGEGHRLLDRHGRFG
jgi:hypothetical protein